MFKRLGDERSQAIAWGQIADVRAARGELDAAMHICEVELLPVYERLGDVRELAIAWGKIADICADRDDLDEALRIYETMRLPEEERIRSCLR